MRHFLHGEIYAAVENVVRPILGTDFLHLSASFAECAGDRLALQHAMVKLVREFLSRGIADGPDEHMGGVRLTLLSALACATRYVKIVTPYFLPDQGVTTALQVAALRGVQIDVVLPERTDVRIVDFATLAQLWQVLGTGVRVWMSPLPFDHSKLMVVDNYWSFIGSANWDARSFRLNFEFNVECYDRELATQITRMADERIAESRAITAEILDGRSLPQRLRDGICRLLTPYL